MQPWQYSQRAVFMKASASGSTEVTGWPTPGYTCSLREREGEGGRGEGEGEGEGGREGGGRGRGT